MKSCETHTDIGKGLLQNGEVLQQPLIQFISSEEVPNEIFFPKRKQRDDKARAAYREELEREDLNGLFIRDIVKEGILPDDPRLR